MIPENQISTLRKHFYSSLFQHVLKTDDNGVPSNADKHNKSSVAIATGIMALLNSESLGARLPGQEAGSRFEEICKVFLENSFALLTHLRPGTWSVTKGVGEGSTIARFDQYSHLADLDEVAKNNPTLAAALGMDYLIKPDVVIFRDPEPDTAINAESNVVSDEHARYTTLRLVNSGNPILHASISCKWTLRSDRAQNARSEALNLVRNRKGRLPHIAVVTGEPTPSRIASIALGTGDVDCVYHFALPELVSTVSTLGYLDAADLLHTMIEGKRLRDIADLPFDLVI